MSALIEITCIVRKESDKAYLVTDDGRLEHWLPKSQVEWHAPDPGKKAGIMVMPEWLAQEKGFI